MKKLFLLLSLIWPVIGLAAGGDSLAYDIEVDSTDVHSLQRGARIFVNYCMGCHSASYMRYNRMGKDLGISEDVLRENFMFGVTKSGSTMDIAMKSGDAEKFFGVAPPDLSVIARSRGEDWLYSYFMTFYRDPDRPFGVNNLTFKDVAMPHVLWELQGIQGPVTKIVMQKDGTETEVIERLELVTPGKLKPKQYEATVYDLVNFLDYLAEPAKFKRYKLGIWVIVYLLCFLVLAWMLKKEYWKDVH
ncbi:MAG TPA: cytochrome c1 [Gammaproteobacteria bacterium]|nr:cytochrome c1 [Gammaproteobacteria bacterium]